ncbi:hypothetical protein [Gluconobacter wancherniae]|uniref:DUF2628 domain-containing protein n=1 Tax=Gluconobacter wancherniae NBRC 103581 TaxID=656744 RepID=A0A511AW05_9PROT|nr:hypothetical protein [Gluconobacter wancherniae]MBF0852594.1 hypothetical protein [Gluconobacter wancherniae]GBD56694.1 hypothetical protein NBRC103581_01274 [Gluconobacter wancherniae NBRC 103581]GBR64367.1 hypothetical protein AA103581_1284 [Gluconobacter wancherniae NBRC 103581]GEK92400.1 hypothetical protein GWA01_01700 [Gluconobacter wancherniae NBRC 103581]
MKLYYPCIDPDHAGQKLPVMVCQGFSWRVLLFGWLGLLFHGAWIAALLTAAGTILLGVLIPGNWHFVLIAALHVTLSAFTPEIRMWEQRINGHRIGQPVAATSPAQALMRWLDHQKPTATPPELPCASL